MIENDAEEIINSGVEESFAEESRWDFSQAWM
jgi:hypothetical protein